MPYRRILISTEQLEQIVSHLARTIHSAYQGVDNHLVLDGAKSFAKDLLAQLDLALEVAEYYRINEKRAKEITQQVKKAVQLWQKIANLYKIPKNEQEFMRSAFI